MMLVPCMVRLLNWRMAAVLETPMECSLCTGWLAAHLRYSAAQLVQVLLHVDLRDARYRRP